jgi:hypothetical protein
VDVKPIFPQNSDTAQARQQVVDNKMLTNTLLDTASDPSSENYNKYVIISAIPRNKAELENYTSPADLENLVNVFTTAQDSAKQTLPDPVTLYQNEKITLLSQDIVDFLNSHIAFRNQL